MNSTVAYSSGKWVPQSEAHLGMDDWGVLQGAMLVERLRTCNGQPLDLNDHIDRLIISCQKIGVGPLNGSEIAHLVLECIERNRPQVDEPDFSVVVLVTPGRKGLTRQVGKPTLIIHSAPLSWTDMNSWYVAGQPLIVATPRNIPASVWSPQIKSRSRLHYYLADCQADRVGPTTGAVMISTADVVTETSSANIIVVDINGRLICPKADSILHGISLKRTLRLAQKANYVIEHRDVGVDDAGMASEILLTGTGGCLWPASRFGAISFESPTNRPVYRALSQMWCEDIGLDYIQQTRGVCASLKNVV